MDTLAKSPEEKLRLISPESVRDTPLELMREAMLQHFEEDRQVHEMVRRMDGRLDPDSEHYALKGIQPFVQGAGALAILWKGLAAMGGLALMIGEIMQMVRGH